VKTSRDKSRIKVVLLEGVHDRAVENFARHGYRSVKRYKKALAGDELRSAIADAHFVGIRSRTRLTRDVIADAPKLMTIGAFWIGAARANRGRRSPVSAFSRTTSWTSRSTCRVCCFRSPAWPGRRSHDRKTRKPGSPAR